VTGHGNLPTQRRRRDAIVVIAVVTAAARGGDEGWRHRQSWRRCGRGSTPTRVHVSDSRRRRAKSPAAAVAPSPKHKGLSSGTNRPSAHLPTVAAAHAGRAAQPSPGDASLAPAPSFGSTLVGGVTAGATVNPVSGLDLPAVPPSLDDVALADNAADHHDAANYQPLLYDTLL